MNIVANMNSEGFILCGISPCHKDTQADKSRQSQLLLCIGWLNAKSFGLKRSHHQAN
jgi:hypothetical protein